MSGLVGVSPNMKSGVVGVYPEGTVIGSEYYFRSLNTNPAIVPCVVGDGGADWNDTDETLLEITVKNANSKMYIWHHSAQVTKLNALIGNIYQKRTIVGGASIQIGGENVHARIEFHTENEYRPATLFTIDPHGQAVGTVIQYYLRGYSNDGNNLYWCADSAQDTINGIVMEIM